MERYTKSKVVEMLLTAHESIELYASQNVLLSAVNARLEKRNIELKKELREQKKR